MPSHFISFRKQRIVVWSNKRTHWWLFLLSVLVWLLFLSSSAYARDFPNGSPCSSDSDCLSNYCDMSGSQNVAWWGTWICQNAPQWSNRYTCSRGEWIQWWACPTQTTPLNPPYSEWDMICSSSQPSPTDCEDRDDGSILTISKVWDEIVWSTWWFDIVFTVGSNPPSSTYTVVVTDTLADPSLADLLSIEVVWSSGFSWLSCDSNTFVCTWTITDPSQWWTATLRVAVDMFQWWNTEVCNSVEIGLYEADILIASDSAQWCLVWYNLSIDKSIVTDYNSWNGNPSFNTYPSNIALWNIYDGDWVVYTFTAINDWPQDAFSPVIIDSLPAWLSILDIIKNDQWSLYTLSSDIDITNVSWFPWWNQIQVHTAWIFEVWDSITMSFSARFDGQHAPTAWQICNEVSFWWNMQNNELTPANNTSDACLDIAPCWLRDCAWEIYGQDFTSTIMPDPNNENYWSITISWRCLIEWTCGMSDNISTSSVTLVYEQCTWTYAINASNNITMNFASNNIWNFSLTQPFTNLQQQLQSFLNAYNDEAWWSYVVADVSTLSHSGTQPLWSFTFDCRSWNPQLSCSKETCSLDTLSQTRLIWWPAWIDFVDLPASLPQDWDIAPAGVQFLSNVQCDTCALQPVVVCDDDENNYTPDEWFLLQMQHLVDGSWTIHDRYISSFQQQPDGRILLWWSFHVVNQQPVSWLVRVLLDGTLDSTFQVPTLNWVVHALALQPDGKILLWWTFTTVNNQQRPYIARLNPDWTLDTNFAPSLNEWVYAITVQTDNNILIWWSFTTVNNQSRPYIARLLSSWELDTSFETTWEVLWINHYMVRTIKTQTLTNWQQRILFWWYLSETAPWWFVKRVMMNWSDDTWFNHITTSSAHGNSWAVHALAFDSEGNILVWWWFDSVQHQNPQGPGEAFYWLHVLHPESWNSLFFPYVNPKFWYNTQTCWWPLCFWSYEIYDILVEDDGKILVWWNFERVDFTPRRNMVRLNTDLSLDAWFDVWLQIWNNISVQQSSVQTLYQQIDWKILVWWKFNRLQYEWNTLYNLWVRLWCSSAWELCGNWVLNEWEQCDYGLNGFGNWCSAACQLETLSCGDTFYDQGWPLHNYPPNQEWVTWEICPLWWAWVVSVAFTSFHLEWSINCTRDRLEVYDGNASVTEEIDRFCGTWLPPLLTSSHSSWCLTFRFYSDDSLEFWGWSANISCVLPWWDWTCLTYTETYDQQPATQTDNACLAWVYSDHTNSAKYRRWRCLWTDWWADSFCKAEKSYCGDGICASWDTCATCPEDCWICVPPLCQQYTTPLSSQPAQSLQTACDPATASDRTDQPDSSTARRWSCTGNDWLTEVFCEAPKALWTCGNGIVELWEECDEWSNNGQPWSLCTTECTVSRCGDGIVQERLWEECDGEVWCTNQCQRAIPECSLIVNPIVLVAWTTANFALSYTQSVPWIAYFACPWWGFCGDGVINPSEWEQCDDGMHCENLDPCISNEQCVWIWDGICRARSGTWCSETCMFEPAESSTDIINTCFNGIQDPWEEWVDCGGPCQPCISSMHTTQLLTRQSIRLSL